jgi:hypothetical protein
MYESFGGLDYVSTAIYVRPNDANVVPWVPYGPKTVRDLSISCSRILQRALSFAAAGTTTVPDRSMRQRSVPTAVLLTWLGCAVKASERATYLIPFVAHESSLGVPRASTEEPPAPAGPSQPLPQLPESSTPSPLRLVRRL